MHNAFVKRMAATLLALCLVTAFSATSVFADNAKKTYTVTFSGGEYGAFSQEFVTRLTGDYGADDVKTVVKDEKIVTVAVRLEEGELLPAAPAVTAGQDGAAELSSWNTTYGVLNAGTTSGQNAADALGNYTVKKVDRNYTLVPEFYLSSGNEVEYMVRFLVTGTETEVAPTQFGKAPAGTQLTMSEPTSVDEYTLDLAATRTANGLAAGDALVLNVVGGDTTPEFVFCYTQNVHIKTETEYEDGSTIVNYNDINLVSGAGVTGGGAAAIPEEEPEAGGETIPEEGTPEAGGETIPEEETPQAGGETIPDEETPQSEPDVSSGLNAPLMIGGGAVLALAVLLIFLAVSKRHSR